MTDHNESITMAMAHNYVYDGARATPRVLVSEEETNVTQLNNEIHPYRSSTPHLDIPNEILAEIFLYCNPMAVVIPWDLTDSPWTMSHVCMQWRSSVLGTPALWRKIRVQGSSLCSHIDDMMTEVIRRSGNRDISMVAFSGENAQAVFDIIATSLSCFEHLSINGGLSELMPILSSPPGSAAGLERLSIGCFGAIETLSFLEGASNIQKLKIPRLVFPASSLLQLSLSKIKSLDLLHHSMESDDVFNILNQCPFIQKCLVGIGGPKKPIESLQPRFLTLPCLEVLTVRLVESAYPAFLASLIMPLLSDFCSCGYVEWAWPIEFTSALAQSKCLEQVRLDSSLAAADLDILLPAAPSLQLLNFSQAELSTQSLQGIACGALLPRIQRFFSPFVVHTLDALDLHLDMLEQRSNYRPSVLFLKLILCWDYDLNDPAPAMRRMCVMIAAGWMIYLD